jgi:hypothetical protein
MGFKIGQVYIHNADDRMAVVTQIRSDGREGLLRFQKTGKEESGFSGPSFSKAGNGAVSELLVKTHQIM